MRSGVEIGERRGKEKRVENMGDEITIECREERTGKYNREE